METTSPVQVKQAAQTQQRRKESHNATEQKRRQRINDKMAELKDILPANKDAVAEKQAPDKATILSDAIEFIRKLHEEVRIANVRLKRCPVTSSTLSTFVMHLRGAMKNEAGGAGARGSRLRFGG